jgi:hypothetical protein
MLLARDVHDRNHRPNLHPELLSKVVDRSRLSDEARYIAYRERFPAMIFCVVVVCVCCGMYCAMFGGFPDDLEEDLDAIVLGTNARSVHGVHVLMRGG